METNRAIGATVILATIVAYWAMTSIRKKLDRKRKRRILQSGLEANATVLNIAPTGAYLNNLPEFQVTIKIHPETGDQFETEVKEVLSFSRYDAIRQGANILVKHDHKQAIFFQLAETLA